MNNRDIWQFEQNKPTLIVNDIIEKYPFIEEDFIYDILLKRGVFKWMTVRRELIRLKDKWKSEIRELNRKKSDKEKGYLKALEKCRKEVRELCHSERFVAPDIDKKAQKYLKKLTQEVIMSIEGEIKNKNCSNCKYMYVDELPEMCCDHKPVCQKDYEYWEGK